MTHSLYQKAANVAKSPYKKIIKPNTKGLVDAFIEFYENKRTGDTDRFLETTGREYAPTGYRIPKKILYDSSKYPGQDNFDSVSARVDSL